MLGIVLGFCVVALFWAMLFVFPLNNAQCSQCQKKFYKLRQDNKISCRVCKKEIGNAILCEPCISKLFATKKLCKCGKFVERICDECKDKIMVCTCELVLSDYCHSCADTHCGLHYPSLDID